MLIRPFISRQSSLNSPRRSWYIAPASSDVPGPITIRGQPGTPILSSVVAEFEVGMIQRISVAGVLVVLCVLLPSLAWAQQSSGIAGVVRDTSGAVLPGVTVEASSPALIEKVRSVTTDGDGRYNIVDLRPGTYVVTFSLAGFNTFKREGVALTAGFTATINAEMQVGALEETITVTGASPLVDTQNVRQQKVVSADLLAALPTGSKAIQNLVTLTPGMNGTADVGGSSGLYRSNGPRAATFHGKAGVKLLYDGMKGLRIAVRGELRFSGLAGRHRQQGEPHHLRTIRLLWRQPQHPVRAGHPARRRRGHGAHGNR
jgi:hypothetical protein